MKRIKFLYILPLIIISCSDSSITRKAEPKNRSQIKGKYIEFKKNTNDSLIYHEFANINLQKVKKQFGRESTTGVLSNQDTRLYFLPKTNGFYGCYYYSDSNSAETFPFIGKVTVFSNKKPWMANDENENIIEVISFSKYFNFIETIKFGMDKNEIINTFGIPIYCDQNFLIFKDSSQAVLSILLSNNQVKSYSIGLYKKVTLRELKESLIRKMSN